MRYVLQDQLFFAYTRKYRFLFVTHKHKPVWKEPRDGLQPYRFTSFLET